MTFHFDGSDFRTSLSVHLYHFVFYPLNNLDLKIMLKKKAHKQRFFFSDIFSKQPK